MPDFLEILVRNKLLDEGQVATAKKTARSSNLSVGDALVKLGYCTNELVTRAKAKSQGLEFIKLDGIEIPPQVVQLIPESIACDRAVLPLAEDKGVLKVAMSDPDDLETLDNLQIVVNRKIKVVLAPRDAILAAVAKC
jgi:type IV pilus assembly protein PilB